MNQANGRLKDAKVGVSIALTGNRLYLRARLPPKSGTGGRHRQQWIFLGYHANPAGVKLAEAEARKVGALLGRKEFSREPYLRSAAIKPETIADWVAKFEADYFQRRSRNQKSETTWRHDYQKIFSQLSSNQALTTEVLKRVILSTEPDTRTRKVVDKCEC